eukprot:9423506-Pyramimonas_sp.AAC.1
MNNTSNGKARAFTASNQLKQPKTVSNLPLGILPVFMTATVRTHTTPKSLKAYYLPSVSSISLPPAPNSPSTSRRLLCELLCTRQQWWQGHEHRPRDPPRPLNLCSAYQPLNPGTMSHRLVCLAAVHRLGVAFVGPAKFCRGNDIACERGHQGRALREHGDVVHMCFWHTWCPHRDIRCPLPEAHLAVHHQLHVPSDRLLAQRVVQVLFCPHEHAPYDQPSP